MAALVRELRITDIRCHAEGCGAGPGERCITGDPQVYFHPLRVDEFKELERAGWEWQEVNPTDLGAGRNKRDR
jgi:hypothetical protein